MVSQKCLVLGHGQFWSQIACVLVLNSVVFFLVCRRTLVFHCWHGKFETYWLKDVRIYLFFTYTFYRAMNVVQSMVLLSQVIHLSVCDADGHIDSTSSKVITRVISLKSSFLGATISAI